LVWLGLISKILYGEMKKGTGSGHISKNQWYKKNLAKKNIKIFINARTMRFCWIYPLHLKYHWNEILSATQARMMFRLRRMKSHPKNYCFHFLPINVVSMPVCHSKINWSACDELAWGVRCSERL
jgi:hypothetical protein